MRLLYDFFSPLVFIGHNDQRLITLLRTVTICDHYSSSQLSNQHLSLAQLVVGNKLGFGVIHPKPRRVWQAAVTLADRSVPCRHLELVYAAIRAKAHALTQCRA